jgi:hypothetical protein
VTDSRRKPAAPPFCALINYFCFLISENLCQSVVENFLSRFFKIPYIKICGF